MEEKTHHPYYSQVSYQVYREKRYSAHPGNNIHIKFMIFLPSESITFAS